MENTTSFVDNRNKTETERKRDTLVEQTLGEMNWQPLMKN